MFVLPVSYTTVNWESLRSIDANSVPKTGDLSVLGTMCRGLHFKDAMSNTELSMFYIAFYVETDNVLPLLECSDLQVAKVQQGYILSGSIKAWVQALEAGLTSASNSKIRKLLGVIYSFLRDAGFAEAFDKFEKVSLQDGTFIFK